MPLDDWMNEIAGMFLNDDGKTFTVVMNDGRKKLIDLKEGKALARVLNKRKNIENEAMRHHGVDTEQADRVITGQQARLATMVNEVKKKSGPL